MAGTKFALRDSMSKVPHIHHRPHVHKSRGSFGKWWSACRCGHLQWHSTWRAAYVDAIIHSETLL